MNRLSSNNKNARSDLANCINEYVEISLIRCNSFVGQEKNEIF